MGRTWIRIYCDKWLEGTLREESLELRGAWADLLALAGKGQYSNTGEIKFSQKLGFSNDQITNILGTTADTWERLKERLVETQRITCDPQTNIIVVLNWPVYQPIFDKRLYMRDYMRGRRERELEEAGKQAAEAKGPPAYIPPVRQPGEEQDPVPTIIARIVQNYEAEIGLITALISQDLADFAQSYAANNAPIAWIDEAFAEAAKNNKRSWAYVRAILNAWIGKGKAGKTGKTEEQVEREWRERQERALQQESSAG